MTLFASAVTLGILILIAAVHVIIVKAAGTWSAEKLIAYAMFEVKIPPKPWYVKYALWLLRHGLV